MPVGTPDGRQRRSRQRRAAGAAVVVVVGTVGGLLLSNELASGSASFITAAATTAGVSQTLSLTGVVQPVKEVAADFQVGGRVSAVQVHMGQQVAAGQKLATIDPTTLQLEVTNDQAILTAADARLTADEENQTSGASPASGNAATTSASGVANPGYVLTAATGPARSGGPGAGRGSLSADQQAVVADQHAVDIDLQASAADFRQAQVACASGSGSPPTTTSTSTTSTTTSTTMPDGSASIGGVSSSAVGTSSTACEAALGLAEQAEAKVNNAEQALATAESNLAQVLSQESSAIGSPTAGGSSASGRSTSAGSSSFGSSATSKAGSSKTSTVNTDTPQQLASDQATIDTDQANLVVAQQSLSDAVLTAPIPGTVVGVSLTANQSVSAGSSSDAVTIISAGTYEADATLSTAQVSELTDGDNAQATINGVNGTFEGTVTRIGPVEGSGSSYTYPLVIALDTGGEQFPAGADAQLTVDLHSVNSAVVVPTSAVHTNGTTTYVLVRKGASEQEQRVTVGVVGAVYTQITSGLSRGTMVILADPSTPVPSSNTQTTTGAGVFGNTGTGAGGAIRAFTGGGGGSVGRGGGAGG